MNLAEFKGLVLDAGIDNLDENTLKAFINAGQRMCDRLADYPHQQGTMTFTPGLGEYFLIFPSRIRIVHKAILRTAETGVQGVPLEKKDLMTLTTWYPRPDDSTFYGTPAIYAPSTSILASFGSPTIGELNIPINAGVVSISDPFDYKGIVLGPTCDKDYWIDVMATAYTAELVADTDASFWTKHYPDILLNAVMYKIEGFFRNSSSATSYLQAVTGDLRFLNYDGYEEEMQDRPNTMGS